MATANTDERRQQLKARLFDLQTETQKAKLEMSALRQKVKECQQAEGVVQAQLAEL
jgi:3-phenylpropionate/cinnamic acid dioxygenase small subunit